MMLFVFFFNKGIPLSNFEQCCRSTLGNVAVNGETQGHLKYPVRHVSPFSMGKCQNKYCFKKVAYQNRSKSFPVYHQA